MGRLSRLFGMAILLLVVLTGIPARAAEGRTPVFAPGIIAVDGRYIVTRNIVGTGAAPVIEIAAPNVDLDLNGFTLFEPAGGFPVINVPAPSEVVIHDGTLQSGSQCIDVPGFGRKLIVEDVKCQDAMGGGSAAIHTADVQNVVIRRTVIQDAPSIAAISLDGPGTVKMGTIEHNVIRRTGAGIVFFQGSSLSVLHNRIEELTPGLGGPGIQYECDGCLIAENTIQDADGEGISYRSGKGGKIYNNVIFSAGSHCIHVFPPAGNALILDNVGTSCGFGGAGGGSGLRVEGGQSLIERNVLNSNSGCGLHFLGGVAAFNTFGRNMARGNGGVACGGAVCAPLFPPNSCDAGGANDTFGDNLIPGPPVF